MIVCQNCFSDAELKSIVKSLKHNDDCDICGKRDFSIDSNINKNEWEQIKDYLTQIKEIYSPENILPAGFPEEKKYILSNLFSNEWNIISSNLSRVQKNSLLKSFFEDEYDENQKYGNQLLLDKSYLKEKSILKDSKWSEFVENLKHKNRFHSKFFNEEILRLFCRCFEKKLAKDEIFYRGRISLSEKGFTSKELNAPPKDKATAGRANAEGISRLYLANSYETVLKEVRAGVFDYVSIAEFKSQKDLLIVDFTALDKYSPFALGIDMSVLAINKENLENINKELGRPMRRTDNPLDYVPTQYLIDFIESLCDEKTGKRLYAGVMYKSVMNPGGINLVSFDLSLFKQYRDIKTLKINSLKYDSAIC